MAETRQTLWQDTPSLDLWITHICHVCAVMNKGKADADDIVSLIYELLPNDPGELNLLLKRIELALSVDDFGSIACRLTNMVVAISAKLEDSNQKADEKISKIADKIRELEQAGGIEKLQQVLLLLPACKNYKIFLQDTFLAAFEIANKEIFQLHKQQCENNSQLIEVIRNLPDLNLDAALQKLLDKYLVIYDIYLTLKKGIFAIEKMIEFTAKFTQNFDLLKSQDDSALKTSAKHALNLFREYIGKENPKQVFMKLAEQFTKENTEENSLRYG